MNNIVIIAILVFIGYYALPIDKPTKPNAIPTIKTENNTVDQASVMKSLKAKAYLTGLEGVLSKSYVYEEKTNVPMLMQRKLRVNIEAKFLLGINCEEIRVVVEGDKVIVVLPESTLISMEVVDTRFAKETGILRAELSDEDKLFLVSKATESAKVDAVSVDNKVKAREGLKTAVSRLIRGCHGVRTVEFM